MIKKIVLGTVMVLGAIYSVTALLRFFLEVGL
jgi:hypothetical protein